MRRSKWLIFAFYKISIFWPSLFCGYFQYNTLPYSSAGNKSWNITRKFVVNLIRAMGNFHFIFPTELSVLLVWVIGQMFSDLSAYVALRYWSVTKHLLTLSFSIKYCIVRVNSTGFWFCFPLLFYFVLFWFFLFNVGYILTSCASF